MQLSFKPQSEEEVMSLLPKGTYKFLVQAAECKTSKAGNPMIEMTLMVWDPKGMQHYVKDWLMPTGMFKLKHFCSATGLDAFYEAGSLAAHDCLGKTGYLKLKVQEADANFQASNKVQDYVAKDKMEKPNALTFPKPTDTDADQELNDDIPF